MYSYALVTRCMIEAGWINFLSFVRFHAIKMPINDYLVPKITTNKSLNKHANCVNVIGRRMGTASKAGSLVQRTGLSISIKIFLIRRSVRNRVCKTRNSSVKTWGLRFTGSFFPT